MCFVYQLHALCLSNRRKRNVLCLLIASAGEGNVLYISCRWDDNVMYCVYQVGGRRRQ
jgi:hypothetical protein